MPVSEERGGAIRADSGDARRAYHQPMNEQAEDAERLRQALREIREVSSLKRLEASLTEDPSARLRLAGEALQRIDVIVGEILDRSTGEGGAA